MDVGDILSLLGRSGHTDLGSRLEVFQDQTPTALFLCRSSVTLIYDDEIEKVRLEQLAEMLLTFITDELLVQGEVNLMGGDGTGIVFTDVDLMGDLFQRGKILLDRLIDQNIAVCKVEDLTLHPALKQAVHDLERGIGFTRAGGHNQEQTILPFGNRVNCAIDCYSLIITGRIGVLATVVRLLLSRLLLRCHAGLQLVASDQFLFAGELIQTELTLHTGQEVMLSKTITVGAVRERKVEHLRIRHSLL